jgi:hypothetical protein
VCAILFLPSPAPASAPHLSLADPPSSVFVGVPLTPLVDTLARQTKQNKGPTPIVSFFFFFYFYFFFFFLPSLIFIVECVHTRE